MKLKKIIPFFIFLVFLGCSGGDIKGDTKSDGIKKDYSHLKEVQAKTAMVTEVYEAVGSIRPKTETRIESQIQAQILSIKATPGKSVKRGDLLIKLDDRRVKSRLNQAKEVLKSSVSGENQAKQEVFAAKAGFDQAESDYERVRKYYKSEAATKRELEQSESSYLQAKANLKRAKEGLEASRAGIRSAKQQVKEAEVFFEYTKITAPEDGEVLKRMSEPGDIALPGKPLLIIQTSGKLRLEAYVREGLIATAKTGDEVKFYIDSLKTESRAIIEEVVPYADPNTRTFLVKAALPQIKGLYPGMYGKLLIPVSKKEVVLIPKKAVLNIGQLEMVNLKIKDDWIRVYVKTGGKNGEDIEILSGIEKGDIIGID
jgi:RND family efflux transporter MFP subunit